MSKVAAAALPLFIAGTGLSLISQIGTTFAQNKVNKQNEAAARSWVDFQRRQTERFNEVEDRKRNRARGALTDAIADDSGAARQQQVDEEADRLAEGAGATDQNIAQAVSDAMFTGQKLAGTEFQGELGRKLAAASAEARRRIEALTKTSAYGSSFNGMGMLQGLGNQNAAFDIGQINDQRYGDTRTLQRFRQIEPETFTFQPSALGPILSGLGSIASSVGSAGMFGPSVPYAPAEDMFGGITGAGGPQGSFLSRLF